MQTWNLPSVAGTLALFAISIPVSAVERNAARDNTPDAARANRLVAGPDIPTGVVAGEDAAEMELRWLDPGTEVNGTTVTYPPGTTGVGTNHLTMPGVPSGGQTLFVGAFISNWGPVAQDSSDPGALGSAFLTLDSGNLGSGLSVYRPPCVTDADCVPLMGDGEGAGCDVTPEAPDCAPAYQWLDHPLWGGRLSTLYFARFRPTISYAACWL